MKGKLTELDTYSTTLVVPCYNESKRLSIGDFAESLELYTWLRLVLVDDGSQDTTIEVLRAIRAEAPERVQVLRLPANLGKAEAVRAGMQKALESETCLVGYMDADLATPLSEVARLRRCALEQNADAVIGSRIRLLGNHVERSFLRHLIGRLFATSASLTLGFPVYDTQCGAKLFRVNESLPTLFAEPFISRWIFDVELLARLASRTSPTAVSLIEVPLQQWRDVSGSRVRPPDLIRASFELLRIFRRYRLHTSTRWEDVGGRFTDRAPRGIHGQ